MTTDATAFIQPTQPRCVEKYDGQTFCDRNDRTLHVDQRAWHDDDGTALAGATCLRCLVVIQALGEQAAAVRAEHLATGASEAAQAAWFVEERRRHEAVLENAFRRPAATALDRREADPGDEDRSER